MDVVTAIPQSPYCKDTSNMSYARFVDGTLHNHTRGSSLVCANRSSNVLSRTELFLRKTIND